MKALELTGQRFGKLIATKILGVNPRGQRLWEVQCDCGKIKQMTTSNLKTSKSCGTCIPHGLGNLTHGLFLNGQQPPLWSIYKNIIQRCTNPNCPDYKWYKNVVIDDYWLGPDGFKHFLDDMLPSFKPGLTIDRKNNLGGYNKDNCHWITIQEQQKNKRNVTLFTYQGVTRSINEWAKIYGIHHNLLMKRLVKLGWSFEKAINEPTSRTLRSNNRIIIINEEAMPVSIAAKKYEIPKHIIYSRLNRGWSPEKAVFTPINQKYNNQKKNSQNN